MNTFKRILAVILSVCMLTLTVGSDYFDATHMDKVEAAEVAVGAAGITMATAFQICLFIGAAVATCYVAGEIVDNRKEIARAGKNFIDSVTEIPEGWLFSITDASTGQDYVFGSEAFELVQDTPWEVIQGGLPPDDNDNNDDKNDDNKNLIDLFSPANQYVGNFLALGATWFIDKAAGLYQKWVNGGELTEAESAVFEALVVGTCNQYDIAAQWSGEPFNYSGNFSYSYKGSNGNVYGESSDFSCIKSVPACAFFKNDPQTKRNSKGELVTYNGISYNIRTISNGIIGSPSMNMGSSSYTAYPDVNYPNSLTHSFSANFPVFDGADSAFNYLKTGDLSDALNYAKVWHVADWLSDDWRGLLIDPLTNIGLSLSQLIELAKALGLNAVGNNLSPEELADLIRESLPAVNPDLMPGASPVVVPDPVPGINPIYYPEPGAHPIIDPKPKPGTDPDPGNDDDGGDNGGGGNGDDTPKNKWAVDLSRFFPFCIPFDLIHLFSVLDADPVTPRWEFPFKIEAYGIDYTFVIDLSPFDGVAEIFRLGETLLFILSLIMSTRNLIRG